MTEPKPWLPDRKILIVEFDDGVELLLKQLNAALERIPTEQGIEILNYLERASQFGHTPIIEWSNMWGPSDAIGQFVPAEFILKFRSDELCFYPDNAFQWIIAHEFAHVYQKAIGRKPGGKSEQENEREADGIAKDWGFNCFSADLIVRDQFDNGTSVEEACENAREIDGLIL